MISDRYLLQFLSALYPSSPDLQLPETFTSDQNSHFQIRAAQTEDVSGLTEILTDSFHSQDGILGWAYPFLKLGIYEDLRNRLRSTAPNHVCLVAVRDTPPDCDGALSDRFVKCDAKASNPHSMHGDHLVAIVELSPRSHHPLNRDRARYLYISNLAVRDTYRRRGVAKQLLLKCERIALAWGFQDLYLHVLENNYQARQLYHKLGYQLDQVDFSWSALFLGRPRQILLHKHLEKSAPMH